MKPDISTTIKGLEQWMKQHCYNFNSYSINGNNIYEGYGIQKSKGKFIWYYTERGQEQDLETFETEEAIVAYAFNKVTLDAWARTHMIGFSPDNTLAEALAIELNAMGIEFIRNDIEHYYAKNVPVYRTFVFGCDVEKTKHLKKKYFKDERP